MLSCCRTYIQAVARATPKLRCTVCDNAVIHSPQEIFGQALLQPGQPHPGQYIWPTSQARFGAMAAASSQSSALFISPATPGQPSAAASPGHQLMVMPMTPPHPRTGPPPSPKAYLDYGLVTQEHHQELVACVFDCGPPRPKCFLTNTGNKRSARWTCHPCNSARKAMGSVDGKNPATKDALSKLKSENPEAYKAKVRSMRIRLPEEGPNAPGVDSIAGRRAAMATFTTKLSQKVKVSEETEQQWMSKNEYFAHLEQRYRKKFQSSAEEDKMWDSLLKNDQILKQGQGEFVEILVTVANKIIASRERTYTREIDHKAILDSQKELEAAIAEVRGTGSGQTALSNAGLFGRLAVSQRPGSSADESRAVNPLANQAVVFFDPRGHPPGNPFRTVGDTAIQAGFDVARVRPAASRTQEDPIEKDRGHLWDNRRFGGASAGSLPEYQELQHEFKSAKHNKAKTIEAFQNKSSAFVRPSHLELAKMYNEQLDLLQASQDRIGEWTMTNMQENSQCHRGHRAPVACDRRQRG